MKGIDAPRLQGLAQLSGYLGSHQARRFGVIIQPFWRKLYSHSVKAVQNYKMHPTYERDYGKVWLEQA